MHEKQILLSPTSFALWVGVFARKSLHFQSGCFPLQLIQGSKIGGGESAGLTSLEDAANDFGVARFLADRQVLFYWP